MNLNDNFLIYNNGINLNQKLRNSLSIKNPNIKIKGRTNFNNNMTIPNIRKINLLYQIELCMDEIFIQIIIILLIIW